MQRKYQILLFIKRLALTISIVALCLTLLLSSCVLLRKPHTAKIKAAKGNTPVARLEFIELGGYRQSVLTRSHNISKPILLFLHGGPGMPMMYMGYKFQRELEKDFIVVHWDQRGAGKSYSSSIAVETINTEQYIADAHELIDTLCKRYSKQKIYLACHSWGTYIGSILANRYPSLFYACISIGQVTDPKLSRELQKDFLISEATKRNNKKALAQIETKGSRVFEKYLFKFGAELKHSTSFIPFIFTGLRAKEYSFKDALNVSKGPNFCGRNMKYTSVDSGIMYAVRDYKIPVYFLTGRSDYVTPGQLIHEYYTKITAPSKEFIWFENSAHFPFFEEPQQFTAAIKKICIYHD
jgi:pimeloyl-ACP methyl ester carboxylesterase